MATKQKITTSYINVHLVRGVKEAIDFLLNTDAHFVEGLFWEAKRYGQAEFTYKDATYELIKNNDLTFTIRECESEDMRYMEAFRG